MSGFRESIDPNWAELLPRDPRTFIGRPNFNAFDESLPIGQYDPQSLLEMDTELTSG